jgi:membrane protein required for colicin V production
LNAVDIAILVVLAVFLLKGLWLGLTHELCGLAGLGMGTLLATRYQASLAAVLPPWASLSPEVDRIFCFILLFLVTLCCFVLLGMVLSRFFSVILLGGLNRVLGGLFGLVQAVLLLALLLYGFSATDWLKELRQQSRLAPPFVELGGKIIAGGRQLLQ